MSVGTSIEWTHIPGTVPATLNAIVGCQKVSEGCRNCYAMTVSHVRAGHSNPKMKAKFGGTTRREGGKTLWTGKVTLSEEALLEPLRKRKPHTYFVNALSDLFYDGVPDEWIHRHFAVFALCPQHTFIVLTKRPPRQREYLSTGTPCSNISREMGDILQGIRKHGDALPHGFEWSTEVRGRVRCAGGLADAYASWPLPNVWLGVSVEDQKTAEERIPLLLQTPAAVRFISAEPLIGEINFRWALWDDWSPNPRRQRQLPSVVRNGRELAGSVDQHDGLRMLDWVICGGESGPGARPMHPDWARGLRDQCVAAGVPYFFKQWGEWVAWSPQHNEGTTVRYLTDDGVMHLLPVKDGSPSVPMIQAGKKAAGHLLDGQEWHQFPERARTEGC